MSKLTDKQYKILGRYMSTYDFVACNQLEKEAEEVLGKNWKAEDDCEQIDSILEHINPNGFRVKYLEDHKFEKDIEVRETDNFTTDPLYIWFNNFVDFVQDNHGNIYNNACEYADKREEDSNA
tara:strand:+ start:397 stop:765 length:369 start_codon:yes stop_codon:yes gene_type:complete